MGGHRLSYFALRFYTLYERIFGFAIVDAALLCSPVTFCLLKGRFTGRWAAEDGRECGPVVGWHQRDLRMRSVKVGEATRRRVGHLGFEVRIGPDQRTLGQAAFCGLQGVGRVAEQEHATLAQLQEHACDPGVCPGSGTTTMTPSP